MLRRAPRIMSDGEPHKRTKGDIAHAVAKAAIGSIPVVGSAGVELFAYVVEAPMEKRREEWMRSVGDAIAELRDRRHIDVDALRDDPAFTDTVVAATQSALRTREAEKLDALRNAVTNAATGINIDAALRQTFIRYVDELSPWHLRLLAFFENPERWANDRNIALPELMAGSPSHVMETALPELQGRRDVYDQWWADLAAKGLVGSGALHTMMSGPGTRAPRTTDLGLRFLRFIRRPD